MLDHFLVTIYGLQTRHHTIITFTPVFGNAAHQSKTSRHENIKFTQTHEYFVPGKLHVNHGDRHITIHDSLKSSLIHQVFKVCSSTPSGASGKLIDVYISTFFHLLILNIAVILKIIKIPLIHFTIKTFYNKPWTSNAPKCLFFP